MPNKPQNGSPFSHPPPSQRAVCRSDPSHLFPGLALTWLWDITGSSWLIQQKPSLFSRTASPSHWPTQPKDLVAVQPPSPPQQETMVVFCSSSTLERQCLYTVKSSWFSLSFSDSEPGYTNQKCSNKPITEATSLGKCKVGWLTCQDRGDKLPCFTLASLQEVDAAHTLTPYPQRLVPAHSLQTR